MSEVNDTLVRGYALDFLTDVNNQPRMNKEKLFADCVAYYRWLLADKETPGALDLYLSEFEAHHGSLVAELDAPVRVACFITWFVEQGLHRLPPLTGFDPNDTSMPRTRFTSPSFRLPTGDPVDSYLVQWLYWHMGSPLRMEPGRGALEPDRTQLERWAREMASELPSWYRMNRAILIERITRFFCWCSTSLRSWQTFIDYVDAFHASKPRWPDEFDPGVWDACFVNWFCQRDCDRAGLPDQGEQAAWEYPGLSSNEM